MNKFTFGPVPSRRLGFSLGVDIIPRKFCSFDCIYCQVGKTTNQEIQRKSFFDVQEVVDEVVEACDPQNHIDVVTFSGSGEPTLNVDIGRMIKEIKKRVDIPVSVITNSSLLYDEDVRQDLKFADIILPSLDAASEDIFHYINRPHALIELDLIIKSLKKLRNEYEGKIWLEIMFIKDINDDAEELEKFKKIIGLLGVDKVQLNTVTRPPKDDAAKGISQPELRKTSRFFGDNCEVVCSFKKIRPKKDIEDRAITILDMLKRRSLTLDDIVKTTGLTLQKAKDTLRTMEHSGKIKSFYFGNSIFYMYKEQ
jgi:wyosine [tRNA(Phe)-imidazoG37] synthetase (radical SAM superfamily)